MSNSTVTKIADSQIAEIIEQLPGTDIATALQELQTWRTQFAHCCVLTSVLEQDVNTTALHPIGTVVYDGLELQITPTVMRVWELEEYSLRLMLGLSDATHTVLVSLDGICTLAAKTIAAENNLQVAS